MNNKVQSIKVVYKVPEHRGIVDELDKQIQELAEGQGLEFVGSGFTYATMERDLEFKAAKEI